jgi:predicted nucleic acid-binding Zn ribbon protein
MKQERPRVKALVVIFWLVIFWPAIIVYVMMVSAEQRNYDLINAIKKK